MNVLETANILLDYYTPEFIEKDTVNNTSFNNSHFTYYINDITYRLYFGLVYNEKTNNFVIANCLRISVSHDIQYCRTFEYQCNEIERFDLLRKMDKVDKEWYKNYIERIKVPIQNNTIDPVIEMPGVEVAAPLDLV